MPKYRYIFAPIIFILLGVLIWRASMLYGSVAGLFSEVVVDSSSELEIKTTRHEKTIIVDKPSTGAGKSTSRRNDGYFETIQETITRIKRDVIVTGTVIGSPGQESAMFQIEGMADRQFKIHTQLMDGFIIKEITGSRVVLKNQVGDEVFFLYVQSSMEDSLESSMESPDSINR